jgi:hypothetical protein
VLKITQSLQEVAVVDAIGTLSPRDAEGFVRIESAVVEVPLGYAYVRESFHRTLTRAEEHACAKVLNRINEAAYNGEVEEYMDAVRWLGAPELRALRRTMEALANKGVLLADVTNDNVAWRDERTIIAIDAEGITL